MGNNKAEEDYTTQQDHDAHGKRPDGRRTFDEVRSRVDDLIGRIHWPLWWPWTPIEPFTEEPEADIIDLDGEFRVTVNLPGVAKDDIEICATRDTIELDAKKTDSRPQSQATYVSRERGCTSFKRVLALSDEIIPDEAKANFENGVLTLILKKKPPEPTRERVKVGVT